jgi:penicillin-insensitive murein endopeptidase
MLLRQASLPTQGQHHAILRRCRNRGTNYGTEELVALLLEGARVVHEEHGGPRLMVGNMSVRGGGDIKWSRSHNSGRDADIAFYVTRKGRAADAPDLLRVDPELRARGGYRFDVPRNWTLVRTLIMSEATQVQWLFVATWIKDALLAHAREIGEDPEIVDRAEAVLWQPTDSTPHADHLHLRVYCSRQDRLEGCLNGAPIWGWVDTYPAAISARLAALERGLDDPDPQVRLDVVAFLRRLQADEASGMLATKAAFDVSPKVRLAALALLRRWRVVTPEVLDGLTRARVAHEDVKSVRAVWAVVRHAGSPTTVPLVLEGVRSDRVVQGVPERWLAVDAASHLMDTQLVPALIDALEDDNPKVREAAATSLRRITNRAWKVRWGRRLSMRKRRDLAARWRDWWSRHKDLDRATLLLRGFRRAGIKLDDLHSWKTADTLVRPTKRPDHVGYNANRVLASLIGRWQGRFGAPPAKRAKRWRKWWRKNAERMKSRLD